MNHPGGLLSVVGPLARSAEDLRLMFAALAGYDSQDPFSAPVALRPADVGGLRIGLAEQFYRVPVDPEIRQTVLRAARMLDGDLKFPVEPFDPQGFERAPNLWWFFFGQLPAPLTKQIIQASESDAHWTATEFLADALAISPLHGGAATAEPC